MKLRQWWADHQQDERERNYHGRAGMWAFIAMSFACVALETIYLAQGRLERVLDIIPVLALGQVVYFGLLLGWRVTR
ncbi:MAG: hypothetical protein JXR33_03485 [Coriobacteriia bacterium]|nr:hypothetical protein [Coriobacteriia bacterium]